MKKYIFAAALIILILAVIITINVFNISRPAAITEIETNITERQPVRISAPVFSLTEFFYDENITLEITYTNDYGDYQIYYTTNGTEPTKGSDLYTKPIEIECTRTETVYPFIVRALHEDGTWSDITYHTIIIGKFVKLDRFNTLVISLKSDPYNLYDYEYGILIEGKLRDEWRAANPNADVTPPMPANFNIRGMAGERPVHIEIFESDGTRVINQNGGVRVYGAWSRAHKLKSMKIYARKEYDTNNWFDYEFFGTDYGYYGNQIEKYKRFVVRNAGNDHHSAYIRDELFHTLARDAGLPDTERVTPVSVFMNGEYFGCYWLHEVYCDEYFQQRYGSYRGDFTVHSIPASTTDPDEEDSRAAADYNKMMEYASSDLTQETTYESLCRLLDVENFLMYYAINTYIDNRDWPHNNHRSYRYYAAEDEEYSDNFPFDGKWRFMMHDSDYSSGNISTNTIAEMVGGRSPMLTALLKRDDCREFFIKYMLDLLNGAFGEKNFVDTLNKMNASRLLEMDSYLAISKLKPGGMTISTVTSGVKTLRDYAAGRPEMVIRHLKNQFKLGDEYYINIVNAEGCGITVNTYTTYDKRYNYTYISDYPTTIKAVIPKGSEFSHWLVDGKKISVEVLQIWDTHDIELILK